MNHDLIPPRLRSALYPVALAVVAILGVYGVVDEEQAAVWAALVAAVLGTGVATAYRPR